MIWLILLQICLLFSSIFVGFYFFSLYRAAYWKRRGVPGPDGKPFSGNLDEMFWEKKLRLFQQYKWSEKYGKIYGLIVGWTRLLVVSDPAIVHEVLTSKFDYFHGRVIMPTMDDSIKVAIELIEKERQLHPDAPINLHRYFVEMTYDVIARVAMGQRESRQFQSEDAKLSVLAFQRFQNNWFEYLAVLFPWLGTFVVRPFILLTGKMRRDPFRLLLDKTRSAITDRQRLRQQNRSNQNGQHRHDGINESDQQQRPVDFIDLFLDAVTEQENIEYKHQLGVFNKSGTKIDRTNTIEEIGMQLMLFMLAGFDTTANSLGFATYNLACHPAVQTKLQEEIDTVCLNENPTYEELSKLKYTEAVIKETLRLIPIAGIVVNRICAQTTTLGDQKTAVEKGTGVAIDVYALHHNKELWGEDVEEFRPERWLEHDRPPASAHFYGFGGGPRICIGMRFALVEEKLALARLLRRYSLIKTEETENSLRMNSQVVVNPGAVLVRLAPRE